jgi:hypothetical protein
MLKKRLRSSDLGTKFANAVEMIAVEATFFSGYLNRPEARPPAPRTTCPPSSLFLDILQAFGGVAEDAKAVAGAGGDSVGRLRTENRATRLVQSSSLIAPSRALPRSAPN